VGTSLALIPDLDEQGGWLDCPAGITLRDGLVKRVVEPIIMYRGVSGVNTRVIFVFPYISIHAIRNQ